MPRRYDLVIVGFGSAGLTAAEFAATLGIKVAVAERDRVGGDCLWTGCVPSKALLASAKAAHTMRHADRYGLTPAEPEIDTSRVWARIHAIQQEIAETDDNPERFEAMGVDVLRAPARLTGPRELDVGGEAVEARFILLCTGSHPAVPGIPGLAEAGYLTSENVFERERVPGSLVLIGGGPIAVELAQGMHRLGVRATVLEQEDRILPRDERSLVELLARRLEEEGVELHTGVRIERVSVDGERKVVHGAGTTWAAEEIFVAAGRRPALDGLGLEAAGVEHGPRGIRVDARSRTNVPSIYAVGDVAGRWLFTHSAGIEAARAIRDMFFPGKGKVPDWVPWCTFTDPELAHAGLTSAEATERHGEEDVKVWRQDLAHSDRARAESAGDGAIVLVTAKGRLVGAHALAPGAGELIHELALAISQDMKLVDLASLVHVYPTLAIAVQQLAGEAAYENARKYAWLVKSKV